MRVGGRRTPRSGCAPINEQPSPNEMDGHCFPTMRYGESVASDSLGANAFKANEPEFLKKRLEPSVKRFALERITLDSAFEHILELAPQPGQSRP